MRYLIIWYDIGTNIHCYFREAGINIVFILQAISNSDTWYYCTYQVL